MTWSERSMRERLAMALWADQFPDVPWDVAEERQREDHLGHIDAILTEQRAYLDDQDKRSMESGIEYSVSPSPTMVRHFVRSWLRTAIRDGK